MPIAQLSRLDQSLWLARSQTARTPAHTQCAASTTQARAHACSTAGTYARALTLTQVRTLARTYTYIHCKGIASCISLCALGVSSVVARSYGFVFVGHRFVEAHVHRTPSRTRLGAPRFGRLLLRNPLGHAGPAPRFRSLDRWWFPVPPPHFAR